MHDNNYNTVTFIINTVLNPKAEVLDIKNTLLYDEKRVFSRFFNCFGLFCYVRGDVVMYNERVRRGFQCIK